MPLLLAVLIVLALLALLGGGVTYDRYGYGAWSPLGVLAVIIVILWLAGVLR